MQSAVIEKSTEFKPVCAQCKFFDAYRGYGYCQKNLEFIAELDGFRGLVKQKRSPNDSACELYSESVPF